MLLSSSYLLDYISKEWLIEGLISVEEVGKVMKYKHIYVYNIHMLWLNPRDKGSEPLNKLTFFKSI